MKKLLTTLILFLSMLCCSVYSAELYRICPACFDISNSLIFIPVKSSSAENLITNNVKLTKMSDYNGVMLEINSAGLDFQPDDLFFSTGDLKEFKIEKNSASTVKLSLFFKDKFNTSNLKIGCVNNNIIITLKPLTPYNMNYYINTYREESINQKDYKEDLAITYKTVQKQPLLNCSTDNKMISEINQAFTNSNYQGAEVYSSYVVNDITESNNLRSKYYLDNISMKDDLFLLSGAGTINMQKPFVLDKPSRIVFDMPNTTLNRELHNKEIVLANGDKIKAAQFNPNTTRIVVTSANSPKYMPVYMPDSQSFLIANPQNIMTSHLPEQKTNIVKTVYQNSDKMDNLIFEFDKPLCYAIKRTSEYLLIYFLNADTYNENNFQSAIHSTPYSETVLTLLKSAGIRLTLPAMLKENINVYVSPDGRVFKLSSQIVKAEEPKPQVKDDESKKIKKREGVITALPKYNSTNKQKIVVIDAGHGGKDCGALRDGIFEKDINLDVSTRVQNILQQKGYKVYMTRNNDTFVSLEDRVIFAEGINPAIFVSIHVNSCNSETPRGIETHYYHDDSLELANCVHTKLIKKINHTPNRGLLKSRFYVINHTTVPSILVEIGFISNEEERKELTTSQRKQLTAEGIAEGIIEFLNSQK